MIPSRPVIVGLIILALLCLYPIFATIFDWWT